MPARSSPPPHGVLIPPFPSLTKEATACIEVYADEVDITFDDAEDEDRLSLAMLVPPSLVVEAPSPPAVPKTASGSMTGPRNFARRMMSPIALGAAFMAGSASAFLAAPRGGAQAAMAPPAVVAKQASDDATVAVPVTVRAARAAAAAPGEAHATELPAKLGMGTKPTRGAARTTTTAAAAPDSPPACREGLVSELPRSHGHTMVAVGSYERCVGVQPLFRPWRLPSAIR